MLWNGKKIKDDKILIQIFLKQKENEKEKENKNKKKGSFSKINDNNNIFKNTNTYIDNKIENVNKVRKKKDLKKYKRILLKHYNNRFSFNSLNCSNEKKCVNK